MSPPPTLDTGEPTEQARRHISRLVAADRAFCALGRSGKSVRMIGEHPAFGSHYYLPDREPFLNLSDLAEPELGSILGRLDVLRGTGLRRVFGRRYMEFRRLTESRLYELFVAVGGRPARRAPHYFTLGECGWFRDLFPGMLVVTVDLADLPSEVASFTYPDSFTSMGFGPTFGLPDETCAHHGRVFRMEELTDVVGRLGMPDGSPDVDYAGYEHRAFEKYIEIQLWSDEPIRRWASHLDADEPA